jgi:diguanylate cyclase (GGDEF)-like protein
VALPNVLGRHGSRPALIWPAALTLVGAVMLSAGASYLVRTVTALVAAYVLLRAARRHQDRLTLARRLFAASLLTGALSGLVAAGYLVATGQPSPTGWVTDWVYLAYVPFAVLAVLSLPRTTGPVGSAVRALADGAVAAGALWYLSMAVLIDPSGLGDDLEPAARFITLAYPLAPAFVVAVILSALPRVAAEARPFLHRAALGVGLIGLSDIAFSLVSWTSTYDPTSWIAAVNELGLLLVLAAAFVGARPAVPETTEADPDVQSPQAVLVLGAPFAPLVLALAVCFVQLLDGEGIPNSQLGPILFVGVAVVVRHVASTRETGALVARMVARERAAQTLARTDALTGLANRTSFVAELDAALADESCHPVAVALLDLNDFKDINDTHGHDTGDEVLRHTADRLRHAVPNGGVARLGGDEFAAFVRASPDSGRSLATEIADAFAVPVRVGMRQFQVRPSVGVVVDERPVGAARPGDASHLLAHADVAMYEAKRSKTVTDVPIAVLTGRARASAAATIRIREEISTPDLDQFHIEYQPVVDLQTGEIAAAEALLRWRHPGFGEISPATFVPLAERVGSIAILGQHVLTIALDDLVRWHSTGATLTVGVNVSPRQLTDPVLADTILGMLLDRGLLPAQLSLEVTEEALVDDIEPVVETIAALRAGGVSVAVDDFGTGYSSLRYLRRFDANIVKIDREFVQASSTEPRTEALVRSVMSMAAALDLTCVAEGIETLEQLALVRSHGCQFGQGYLLARPMPAAALAELLIAGHVYPVDVSPPRQRHDPPIPIRSVT